MSSFRRGRSLLSSARPVIALAVVSAAVAACGTTGDSGSTTTSATVGPDGVSVVASTNVYGAIVEAVAGDHATVTSLFSNTAGDPHEYEATAQDTLAVQEAQLIVFNGGDYDAYIEQASETAPGVKIDAFTAAESAGSESEEAPTEAADEHAGHGHAAEETSTEESAADEAGADAHAGHDHSVNEHMFYDLPAMGDLADAIAEALSEIDPANATDYRDGATEFGTRLDVIIADAQAIGTEQPGATVASTEPLAGYLLELAGVTDLTPSDFAEAVEEGTDPAPADIAATDALVTDREVRAVVLNTQTTSAVTDRLVETAEAANVPVVRFTETLPEGVTDYLTWQASNVDQLSQAVATGS